MIKSLKCAARIAAVAAGCIMPLSGAFAQTAWQHLARAPDISATTSSSNQALGAQAPTARVCNTGANPAYVQFGTSNSVASTLAGSTLVPAGGCVSMNAVGQSYVAAITPTGTTVIQTELGTGALNLAGDGSQQPITGTVIVPPYPAQSCAASGDQAPLSIPSTMTLTLPNTSCLCAQVSVPQSNTADIAVTYDGLTPSSSVGARWTAGSQFQICGYSLLVSLKLAPVSGTQSINFQYTK